MPTVCSNDSLLIEQSLQAIEAWLDQYITRTHPDIGRPGAICPFVAPARAANTLEMRVRLVGSTPSLDLIQELTRCALEEYETIRWANGNQNLHALIVLVPDLSTEHLHLLDEAHAIIKPECVRRGRMIGQFHPLCTETAARSPAFEVSKSPVPLFAIRNMAIHDVFFLQERKEWLESYVERFGRYYARKSAALDSALTTTYWKACRAHEVTGTV